MTVVELASGLMMGIILSLVGFMAKTRIAQLRAKDTVLVQMRLNEGRTIFALRRPGADGRIKTKQGTLFTRTDSFDIVGTIPQAAKGKRHFRYKEGNPFPYAYGERLVMRHKPDRTFDPIFDSPLEAATNGGTAEVIRENPRIFETEGKTGKTMQATYEGFDEPKVIPSGVVATYFDQHDFREMYGRRGDIIMLALIGFAALAIGVVIGLQTG